MNLGKKQKNALMELIGNKFQSNECNTTSATATSDTTLRDIVQSELFRYKAELWINGHCIGGLPISIYIQTYVKWHASIFVW